MDLFGYIKKYGKYSFKEKKFNEVDNVILSCLTYVNFTKIVSDNLSSKITLKEAGNIYFSIYEEKIRKRKVPTIKSGILLLKAIKDTKRFKDILVYNYKYSADESSQFGAVSFDLDNNTTYIAYEGTDHLLSGWKEDCKIAYIFPVKAQSLAISYLNEYLFTCKKLIIGGHSKGGHLAIIASMYSNYFVRRRIVKIYSNDGLGIRKEEFESRKYKKIESKISKMIPSYSIIGHLLNSSSYRIIKTNRKSIKSHNPLFWVVRDNKFEQCDNSKSCIILRRTIYKYLAKYDLDTKINFVDEFFKICKDNNIDTFQGLKDNKKLLIKEVFESDKIDIKAKDMFNNIYTVVKESLKEEKEESKK